MPDSWHVPDAAQGVLRQTHPVSALRAASLLASLGLTLAAASPGLPPSLASPSVAASDAPAPSASASASASADPARSQLALAWTVVSRRPHDDAAFTQGLLLDDEGRLFESTGDYGSSTVREVDPASGEVLRSRAQPAHQFGEGLALEGDELVQLTWQSGVARRFEADTFELAGRHRYEGEGWGLCFDGERLVMSDGSDRLTFRDPQTFEELGSMAVTLGGAPQRLLNELECLDGEVWANVYRSDSIVRIDPADGAVTGVLDLAGIIEPHPAARDHSAVLNGIAWDEAAGTFLVTGKRWPELIEIRVFEPEVDPSATIGSPASSPRPEPSPSATAPGQAFG
jgi:glutaminyl-peptide cyclotransferase